MSPRWPWLAGLWLTASPVAADTIPNDIDFVCHLHHAGGIDLNSIGKLPPSIKDWIASNIGPMADRGAPFNATDVIADKKLPTARFLRAGRVNDYWFIWYERGGIAFTKHIVLLHLDLELTQVADETYTNMEDPCPMTDALLDQQR
jgi:hypothetical protein